MMSNNFKLSLIIYGLVVAGIVSTVGIFAARLVSTLLHGDFQYTSGGAGIGVYGVLLKCQKYDIYNNIENDPNGYIFNFLFYETYGFIANILSSCDEYGILISRVFTAIIALSASFLTAFMARAAGCRLLIACFIAMAPISPFIGWWAFSVRPDVGGLLASLLALAATRRAISQQSYVFAASAILFALIAWGFKQPYIVLIPLSALLIIAGPSNRKLQVVTVGLAMLALCGIGLSLTIDGYYLHTFVFPSSHEFSVRSAVNNLVKFTLKASPFLALFALGIMLTARDKGIRGLPLLSLGALTATFMVFAGAAAKVGASDNYFFLVFAFIIALIGPLISKLPERSVKISVAVSAVVMLTSNSIVLSGAIGQLVLEPSNSESRIEFKEYIQSFYGRKLVVDNLYALPTYAGDIDVRLLDMYIYQHGVSRVEGAIAVHDQVKSGAFDVVALGKRYASDFDLGRYTEVRTIGPMMIFRLKGTSKNPHRLP